MHPHIRRPTPYAERSEQRRRLPRDAHRLYDLVAFDMEGCLTDDPTVWELMHRKVGTWDSHGRPYWDRYRAGKLDYDTFARLDVAAWAGAPVQLLESASAEVPLMHGAPELLRRLRAEGIRVAIISNGITHVARRFRALGVGHIYANRVVTSRGRLTGVIRICVPYAGKGRVLRALAERFGVRRERIAAVGDSQSDIALFRAAGLRIAFRPEHPSVSAAATFTVDDPDVLARLLPGPFFRPRTWAR